MFVLCPPSQFYIKRHVLPLAGDLCAYSHPHATHHFPNPAPLSSTARLSVAVVVVGTKDSLTSYRPPWHSIHMMGAQNGVCVHVCFPLLIHMDEGVFKEGLNKWLVVVCPNTHNTTQHNTHVESFQFTPNTPLHIFFILWSLYTHFISVVSVSVFPICSCLQCSGSVRLRLPNISNKFEADLLKSPKWFLGCNKNIAFKNVNYSDVADSKGVVGVWVKV